MQTHGMIAPHGHPLAAMIDRLWTVKLLRSAAMVFHLNSTERQDLCTVGGTELPLRELRNGVPTLAARISGPLVGASFPRCCSLPDCMIARGQEVVAAAAFSLLKSGVRARFAVGGTACGSGVRR